MCGDGVGWDAWHGIPGICMAFYWVQGGGCGADEVEIDNRTGYKRIITVSAS
jgi:hypothetical protein